MNAKTSGKARQATYRLKRKRFHTINASSQSSLVNVKSSSLRVVAATAMPVITALRTLAVIAFMFPVLSVRAEDEVAKMTRMCAAAQEKIEADIAASDTVLVEAVEGKDKKRFLWQSSSPKDLHALSGAFRIKPFRVVREVVDGKEQISFMATSCYCYGQLWVTLMRGPDVLLRFLIKHGTKIGSDTLGAFDVERVPLAPFYDKMMAVERATRPPRASQTPQAK